MPDDCPPDSTVPPSDLYSPDLEQRFQASIQNPKDGGLRDWPRRVGKTGLAACPVGSTVELGKHDQGNVKLQCQPRQAGCGPG